MEVSKNAWSISWKIPRNMDDLKVHPYFRKPPNDGTTPGKNMKRLLSAMAMLVCWRCNPKQLPNFENQQLAPTKFSETVILNPPVLTHPLWGGTLHKLTPFVVLVAFQPLHLVQESIHQLTGVANVSVQPGSLQRVFTKSKQHTKYGYCTYFSIFVSYVWNLVTQQDPNGPRIP